MEPRVEPSFASGRRLTQPHLQRSSVAPHHRDGTSDSNSSTPIAPTPPPHHHHQRLQVAALKDFRFGRSNSQVGEELERRRRQAATARRESRLLLAPLVDDDAPPPPATSRVVPHAPLAAPTPMMFPRQPMCDPMDLSIPNRVLHILFDNFANSRAGMNTGARGGSRTSLFKLSSLHVAINKLWPGHLVPSQMLEQATAAVIAERNVLALVAHGGDGTWVDFSEFLKILRVIANLNNFRSVLPSAMPMQLGAHDFNNCARCLGIRRPGKLFAELSATPRRQADGTFRLVEGDTVSQTTIAMWFAAQSRVVSFSRSVLARPAADSEPALRLAQQRQQRDAEQRLLVERAEADARMQADRLELQQIDEIARAAETHFRRQQELERVRLAEEAEAAERAQRERDELERKRRAEEVEAAFRRQEQEEHSAQRQRCLGEEQAQLRCRIEEEEAAEWRRREQKQRELMDPQSPRRRRYEVKKTHQRQMSERPHLWQLQLLEFSRREIIEADQRAANDVMRLAIKYSFAKAQAQEELRLLLWLEEELRQQKA